MSSGRGVASRVLSLPRGMNEGGVELGERGHVDSKD